MKHLFSCLLLAFLLASPALALTDPVGIEELVGETLCFRVYWTGIPAAEAQLKVERAGPDTLRFVSTAKALSAVRLIYPLDSRLESEVRIPGIQPLRYRKSGREGWGKEHEREVVYDIAAGTSLYYRDDKLRTTLKIPPDTQDPLSCFFFYRTSPVADDQPVDLHVDDGKRLVEGTVSIVGREKITVPAGTFSTVIVEPKLEGIGGIFAKSPGARLLLWLTDDKWRRPVKMRSEVVVGSFTALLERFDPPTPPPPVPQSAPASPAAPLP
jgi:hypothetical protein